MRIAYEILILHSINMKDVLEEDFIDRSCFKFPDLDKQMKIGSGGFGRVFKNELKSEQVAIKIQEEKKKSFSVILNEFGILKRLHHQFVVETYGLVRYKQKDCIVMPFVDGGSLKDLTQNKLTLFEALNMMKNLSKGLAYIHRLQVIHQDIKPHNILLKYPKTEGSSRQPVIIDFGLAANLLNRKSLRGFTWQYSDPDQIENKSPGFEADIWSFGMTFYWVLFQKNPFSLSGDKRKDLSYPRNQARLVHKMIKKEGLRPVIDYRFQEDFPLITQILKDCWKVNPKDRPSAIEVCKRLDDIIRNFKGLERLI
jgi:serine/threonine protein kinase